MTKLIVWILGLLVILGTVLRWHTLGRQSISFDETVSIVTARQTFRDILAARYSDRANPPLYYAILRGHVSILDTLNIPIRDTAFRIPSFVFGVLSTVLFTALVYASFASKKQSVTATVLFITSPALIHFSQIARSYMLAACFSVLLLMYSRRLLISDNPGSAVIGITCCMIGLLYSHYSALLFIGVYVLSMIILFCWKRRGSRKIIALISACVFAFVGFIPIFTAHLLPSLVSGNPEIRFNPQVDSGGRYVPFDEVTAFLTTDTLAALPQSIRIAVYVIFTAVSLYQLYTLKNKKNIFLTFIGIFICLLFLAAGIPTTRRIYVNPYYYLLFAVPLYVWIAHLLGNSRTAHILLILVVLAVHDADLSHYYTGIHEVQYREAASALREEGARNGSPVYADPCLLSVPLRHFYAVHLRYECYDQTTEISSGEIYVLLGKDWPQMTGRPREQLTGELYKKGYVMDTAMDVFGISVLRFTHY